MKRYLLSIVVLLAFVANVLADGTSGGGGGGGGGGAPTDSTYVVVGVTSGLSDERAATAGTGISLTDGGAGSTLTFLINQAFTPTWTGAHAFTAAINSTAVINMNAASYLTGAGTTEPYATCPAGSGAIFYEQSSDKWRVCQSSGSFADLVVAGGTDLTAIPFLTTSASALLSAENVLTQGVGILISTTGGTTTLDIDAISAACSGNLGVVANGIDFCQNGIGFEGTGADTVESWLVQDNPSAEQTIHIPDLPGSTASAILITDADSGTVTGTMIATNTVGATDLGICTTNGGIAYHNGTQWVCRAIGAESDVLTVSSGIPAWAPNACEGGGAPSDIAYMVATGDASLSAEQVITDGAAIAWTTATLADPDTISADLLYDSTFFSVSGINELTPEEAGFEGVIDLSDLQGAVTDAQVPNTITINTAAAATALAANGANCSAGSYPLGVDASGAVESCTAVTTGNPLAVLSLFEEFITPGVAADAVGNLGWTKEGNGSGNAFSINTTAAGAVNRPGVASLETGTAGAAAYILIQLGKNDIVLGGGVLTYKTDVRVEDLSTAGEEYVFRVGFCDAATDGDCTDGVYFEYDRLTNVNWQIVTASNTSRTREDTGIAVAADTWFNLSFVVNADATSISYTVDGGTPAASPITATIPTTTSRATGPMIQLNKDLGGTNRAIYVDYVKIDQTFTTPRT